MAISYHRNDLPAGLAFADGIAVDTETTGLSLVRDRLCVLQLSGGDGNAHIVHFVDRTYDAPNLCKLLADTQVPKIFHFARFDLAMIQRHFGIICAPVFCTKIASRLTRTNTDRHGLKDLVHEVLGIELSKQQQSSDWGAPTLDEAQLTYAAADVLHLHAVRRKLEALLERENRRGFAQACFNFLPARAALDLAGWPEEDIFAH